MPDQNNQSDGGRPGGDTSNRGFAAMDDSKQREIASKGGASVSDDDRSFSKDPDLAAEAGRKGGESSRGAGTTGLDDGGSASSGRDDDITGRTESGADAGGQDENVGDTPQPAADPGRAGGGTSGGGR